MAYGVQNGAYGVSSACYEMWAPVAKGKLATCRGKGK